VALAAALPHHATAVIAPSSPQTPAMPVSTQSAMVRPRPPPRRTPLQTATSANCSSSAEARQNAAASARPSDGPTKSATHGTPSKRALTVGSSGAPQAPESKRSRVVVVPPPIIRTVCKFGTLSTCGGERTYSALLVPFIHAVINRVSAITNEAPPGGALHFKFGFTTFPIRARNPVEFDAVVDGYARAYIARGITRSFVSDQFCKRVTGHIDDDDQERLTDPSHDTTMIPNVLFTWFARLCALGQ
jgi:hypothetical protein